MPKLLWHHPVPGGQKTRDGFEIHWHTPWVMGIVNVTPDSFSDGGKSQKHCVEHALHLEKMGAHILDIGAESTRPGAEEIDIETELDRLMPVLNALQNNTSALISVDTRKPEVAREALKAGAHLINDVSGLRHPDMVSVCAEFGVPAIIMHMKGTPQTMQNKPQYQNAAQEVGAFLTERAEHALASGVPSVAIDPGFGFGKSLEHNIALLQNLRQLTRLNYPVLVGLSRKNMVGQLGDTEHPKDRDFGTVAAHLFAIEQGAAIVRVHDVFGHVQALKVWNALRGNHG
ncbi:MAG: dihydropteroate synthase [Deinococcaceae bacterium]